MLIYQNLLKWESAIYHSIKLPFDAEVAEKFPKFNIGLLIWTAIVESLGTHQWNSLDHFQKSILSPNQNIH